MKIRHAVRLVGLTIAFAGLCSGRTHAAGSSLPDLIQQLEQPVREVWLPAADAIVSLGHDAARPLRRRRAEIVNPRVAARFDSLLREILPLRVGLELEPRTLQVGEPIFYGVTLVNDTGRRLLLPMPTDGSEDGVRFPRTALEIVAPDGAPASGGPRWSRAGEIAPLRRDDFRWLGEGKTIHLIGAPDDPHRARLPGHWWWSPPGPGLYRIRFVYDCSSRNWNDWRARSAEPGFDVKKKWIESYRGRVTSGWVTINVVE